MTDEPIAQRKVKLKVQRKNIVEELKMMRERRDEVVGTECTSVCMTCPLVSLQHVRGDRNRKKGKKKNNKCLNINQPEC